jgi:ferredoxin--NADP+ reductase/benzoate/toluate 1,2-dioxygenase reductase subunit
LCEVAWLSDEPAGGFQGRVTDCLRGHPVDTEGVYCLCGNCGMLLEAYDVRVDRGVPRERIMSEVFY